MNAANHIRDWLKQLGVRIAPSIAPREFAGRINILAQDLAEEFPAEAFTRASMKHIAETYPRYWPSYGEVCVALRPWWREHRPTPTALPEPASQAPDSDEEIAVRQSWEDITPGEVRAKVRAIQQLSGIAATALGPCLAAALARYAPHQLGLLPPVWIKDYAAKVVPLRPAAADMPEEVRRGPILEDDPP